MTAFNNRIAKLEEISRAKPGGDRVPGVPEELMEEIRRVAAVCGTWQELAAFIATLSQDDGERDVVSIDDRQRRDAVFGALARTIMEEVRDETQLRAG